MGYILYAQDSGLLQKSLKVLKQKYNKVLHKIILDAQSQGYATPSLEYYEKLDQKVLDYAQFKF